MVRGTSKNLLIITSTLTLLHREKGETEFLEVPSYKLYVVNLSSTDFLSCGEERGEVQDRAKINDIS